MSNSWREWVVAGLVAVSTAACTKTVNQCEVDSNCKNVAYPFCDVNGEYPSSGGVMNVCTIVPANCPVERCGCQPGAATCDQDRLVVCDPSGTATTATSCSLGCADTKDHCLTFTPSNGLETAFAGALSQPDVIIPDGTSINTDTGLLLGPDNKLISVASLIVTHPTGDIRVYVAKSFSFKGVTITGSKAVAFVAEDDITIDGLVDASANGNIPGPGGQTTFSSCQGVYAQVGGGGANAGAGGTGISRPTSTDPVAYGPGGTAQIALTTLVGGCAGGTAAPNNGGAGGGAVQLVAGGSATFKPAAGTDAGGVLDVGGGGGPLSSGGGSGGNIIIEAPHVDIEGRLTANGGGGGCGPNPGEDGHPSAATALGGCYRSPGTGPHGGSGGTKNSVSGGSGTFGIQTGNFGDLAGGGSVGRAIIRTGDGTYVTGTQAIISVVATTDTLTLK